MKVGDKVLISPDLTLQKEWVSGTIIQVENNPFVGIVISAETEDRNVFFGRARPDFAKGVGVGHNHPSGK